MMSSNKFSDDFRGCVHQAARSQARIISQRLP
ncbi:hypothetical protein SAMN05216236_15223 [Sedimentitalea nanhaiensis]|uniref:Uncharacterized protein n=1 Tax=Sedimentitalea nanhaiensis TaxID=999627 RepID=A0A1I7E9H0_9RHOB|nr:hypothetical protein SAMN05216236_15223 [Sedimentitalea nanhaiensis]